MEGPTRIILAVRVGNASAGPGRTAAWLASSLGTELTLVYVATELGTAREVAVAAGIPEADVRARLVAEAREKAEQWGRDALDGLAFDVVIEEGAVADRVAAVALELDADLIIAGSEARGPIRGIILGDTTAEILRRAPCPVVVVPPRAEA
jgi:nucleotide-binding universal stress UspA family protein